MKFKILYFGFLLVSLYSLGQPRFNVAGDYKGLSAQGIAIYGHEAFLFNHTGWCRIFNLEQKKVFRDFPIGSYDKFNHANSASLGNEKMHQSKYPVVYVSECSRPYRCFVESINDTASYLVQTISLDRYGEDGVAYNWFVDKKHRSLYSIARKQKTSDDGSWTCVHRINRYRLPRLKDGEKIVFSDKDVIESFDVSFPNLLQGGCIKGKYLYLPTGLFDTKEDRLDKERALIIVNIKRQKIEKVVDLAKITSNEPEDCDFYKGKLLLYCGQSGGLYEIPIK